MTTPNDAISHQKTNFNWTSNVWHSNQIAAKAAKYSLVGISLVATTELVVNTVKKAFQFVERLFSKVFFAPFHFFFANKAVGNLKDEVSEENIPETEPKAAQKKHLPIKSLAAIGSSIAIPSLLYLGYVLFGGKASMPDVIPLQSSVMEYTPLANIFENFPKP